MENEKPDGKILDRIAKCMQLSRCADRGEAAAALAAAQRLAEKYNISDEAVRFADVKEVSAQSSVMLKPAIWESFLVVVVADAFRCKSIFRSTGYKRAEWVFIGGKTATEIAAYAYDTLFRRLRAARREHISSLGRMGQKGKTKHGDAFCVGWVEAIRRKVGDFAGTKEEEDRLEGYIDQRYAPAVLESNNRITGKIDRHEALSFCAGVVAGKSVELRHGVTAGDTAMIATNTA